jgi:hypothetical protein
LSATTATALSPTATTVRTPGFDLILLASKDCSVPPNTGHCAMAAFSMSGSCTSMAKICLPDSLSTVSRRFTPLPISVHCAGVLSFTSVGTGSFAASAASSP